MVVLKRKHCKIYLVETKLLVPTTNHRFTIFILHACQVQIILTILKLPSYQHGFCGNYIISQNTKFLWKIWLLKNKYLNKDHDIDDHLFLWKHVFENKWNIQILDSKLPRKDVYIVFELRWIPTAPRQYYGGTYAYGLTCINGHKLAN